MKKKVETIDHNKRVFDMIRLLRKNGRMKAKELTKALDLKNGRSVSNYKLCIEKLGYNIQSFGGYYGGYEIREERLSEEEIEIIASEIKDKKLIEKIKRVNNKI